MLFSALFALAATLGASAIPTGFTGFKNLLAERQMGSAPSNTDILQYALTLEHLEATFYHDAMQNFSAADFSNAGYPDWVRARFMQVAGEEADHVSFLTSALGSSANAACTYSFPYTDVPSFIALAATIENVGVSAYAGAAQYITNGAYLTAAAAILATEARHQTWENSAATSGAPWSSGFDTPLGLDMVYTLVTPFFTGCPSSNMALPVMAYPALTVSACKAGEMATFTFNDAHNATNYAVFYSGLGSMAVQLDENDMAMVPDTLSGYFYVLISTEGNATMVSSDNIVAGPAIVDIGLDAYATVYEFGLGLNGTYTS